MSLAEAAFKERVAKLIKVQLFQKTQDGSWNGGKMGWAHWQTKESYINLWYKPIQEEKEPATQEKAVQTDGSAGAHRWMLTVLSRPIMLSKSYIMSVASALHCPQRNSDQGAAAPKEQQQALSVRTESSPCPGKAFEYKQPEEGPLHHKQAQEDEEEDARERCANPACYYTNNKISPFCCIACYESYNECHGAAESIWINHDPVCDRRRPERRVAAKSASNEGRR